MLEGKLVEVGVAGRTLTEEWGLRPSLILPEAVGEPMTEAEAEDVDEALECEWWCW